MDGLSILNNAITKYSYSPKLNSKKLELEVEQTIFWEYWLKKEAPYMTITAVEKAVGVILENEPRNSIGLKYKKLINNNAIFLDGNSDWITIHNEGGEKIEVRFYIQSDLCSSNKKSNIEYKGSGINKKTGKKVNWKFEYESCRGYNLTEDISVSFDDLIDGKHKYTSQEFSGAFVTGLPFSISIYTPPSNKSVFPLNAWSDWQVLHNSNGVKIEVKFKLRSASCKGIGASSKFKYKASGIYSFDTRVLNWSFDYIDCYGNKLTNTSVLDFKSVYTGSYMSGDDTFTGKSIVKKPYGIKVN